MTYTMEKQILTEFLQLYKSLPCLWDTTNSFYSNKVARNRAYDTLFETYKRLDSMADRNRVKKKLENMRTTYKRERQKVIRSQFSGDEVYTPSLWYFNLMTFLDALEPEGESTHITQSITGSTSTAHTEIISDDHDDDAEDYDTEEEDKPKSIPTKRPKPMSVFVKENDYENTKITSPKKAKKSAYTSEDNDYQEEPYIIKSEPSDDVFIGSTTEPDLFGKTISAQLSELRPKQRFIAEKLISEVVFFGRLDKLKTGSKLNLNDDSF